MTGEERIAWLEARFLRRERARLGDARALARETRDPRALWERFAREGWLPDGFEVPGARWYRPGPRAAAAKGSVVVHGSGGPARAVLPWPATAEHACHVALDAVGMLEAEGHALRAAEALWRAAGSVGEPPRVLVWRLSGWDVASRHEPVLLGQEARVRAPVPRGDLSRPFGIVAGLIDAGAAWDLERDRGTVPDVDWVTPLLELWGTGFGLRGITPGGIQLFQPIEHVSPREPTPALPALRGLWERGLATLDVGLLQHAAGRGARAGARDLAELASRLPWNPTRPDARIEAITRVLLAAGASPWGGGGGHPLQAAAVRGEEVAKAMVSGGIPVDQGDPRGRTALHELAVQGHAIGIERLLAAGADPDVRDELGWSPVHLALYHGHPQVLDRLEKGGARFDRATGGGLDAAALIAHHPEGLAGQLRLFVQAASPAAAVVPGLLEVPPQLAAAARDEVPGSWTVLADWLTERGDPRGPALASSLAGRAPGADADAVAGASRARRALLGVHAGMEALLADRAVILEERGAFPVSARLLAGTSSRHAPAVAALVGSSAGALLRRVDAVGGAGALLAALAGVRAPVPCDLRALALESSPGTLDLAGLSGLRLLALHGRGAEAVGLAHPTLHTLVVERPNLRDEDAGPPVHELRTPVLRTLFVTCHRAPRGDEAGWLVGLAARPPGALTRLALRPTSVEAMEILVGSPLLARLQVLELDSCLLPTVELLIARAPSFAHLDRITVTLLQVPRLERAALRTQLVRVLPNAHLSGLGFRGQGGYGEPTHPRGAMGALDPGARRG